MLLRLPKRGHLPPTGPVDAIDRYWDPVVGPVLRQRLVWARTALPAGPLDRVLEVGYGSGIFQYTLAPMARVSVAIDVHPCGARIGARLAEDGIVARLAQGDGCALPFADGSFDAVVILSALEFVDDPGHCLAEALRVLRPGGRVVALTPRILPWADSLYRRLVGFDPESEFQGGRQRVQAALARAGARVHRYPKPRLVPAALAPYELVVLEPDPDP